MKSYSELILLPTFAERLDYLSKAQKVGEATFGEDRYLNQILYHTSEWRRVRNLVISRDNGCDLGIPDLPIFDRIYIHHIVPVTAEDIINRTRLVLDPDNLISVSFNTHQLIHYGVKSDKLPIMAERKPGDTCPWIH